MNGGSKRLLHRSDSLTHVYRAISSPDKEVGQTASARVRNIRVAVSTLFTVPYEPSEGTTLATILHQRLELDDSRTDIQRWTCEVLGSCPPSAGGR